MVQVIIPSFAGMMKRGCFSKTSQRLRDFFPRNTKVYYCYIILAIYANLTFDEGIMIDGYIKSPYAALRFLLRRCGVFRGHVPIPLGFRNKPPPRRLIPQTGQ
jgi:predicted Na+-dependent transporter